MWSTIMATGTVKFFDEDKGWGFIVPDDGKGDVFLHRSQIGARTIDEGAPVTFDIAETTKGRKAVNVKHVS